MKIYNAMKLSAVTVVLSLLFTVAASAQNQQLTPEQQEKKMYEMIDKEVERLTSLLKLDEAQQYYVTITLTDCLQGRQAEIMSMSEAKVQNPDLYQMVLDKWVDKIEADYESYFTPEQWKKYLRSGAEKDRKAREKRREKAQLSAEK